VRLEEEEKVFKPNELRGATFDLIGALPGDSGFMGTIFSDEPRKYAVFVACAASAVDDIESAHGFIGAGSYPLALKKMQGEIGSIGEVRLFVCDKRWKDEETK